MNQPRTAPERFPTSLYVDECLKSTHPHLVTDPIMRRIIAQEVHKWMCLVESDARARLAAAEAQVAALRRYAVVVHRDKDTTLCRECGHQWDARKPGEHHRAGCTIADTAQAAREWEERVRAGVIKDCLFVIDSTVDIERADLATLKERVRALGVGPADLEEKE